MEEERDSIEAQMAKLAEMLKNQEQKIKDAKRDAVRAIFEGDLIE